MTFFFLLLQVYSQNRGDHSFAAPGAIPLKINTSTSEAGNGYYDGSFLGGVGGISFDKTATTASGFSINDLAISYNQSKPDGSRMVLTINGNDVNYCLYDWQMIPIARYAESEFTACFTYFGSLEDKNCEDVVLNNGGHILNYHPAFSNTLLGWRLADMDMLILYDFTTDLPKVNGNYVLGAGEQVPDVYANRDGAYDFYNYLVSVENDLGYTFRSYVITDYSQNLEMNISNDSLLISGYPYYYAWRLRRDQPGFSQQAVYDSIDNHYQTVLNQKLQENPDYYERGLYIDSLIVLSKLYPDSYPIYESGTFIDLVELNTFEEKTTFLERYTTGSLKTMCVEVSANMFAYEVQMLNEFSDRMSAKPEKIAAWNPEVWNATVTTMRTAAFFRYVKENFPVQWQSFLNQVSNLIPEPEVTTPTIIYDKGNTIIEEALRSICPVIPAATIEINCFPNPVHNDLFINNLKDGCTISLVNVHGKNIFYKISNSSAEQISFRQFNPGIYILNISTDDETIYSQKIVKE